MPKIEFKVSPLFLPLNYIIQRFISLVYIYSSEIAYELPVFFFNFPSIFYLLFIWIFNCLHIFLLIFWFLIFLSIFSAAFTIFARSYAQFSLCRKQIPSIFAVSFLFYFAPFDWLILLNRSVVNMNSLNRPIVEEISKPYKTCNKIQRVSRKNIELFIKLSSGFSGWKITKQTSLLASKCVWSKFYGFVKIANSHLIERICLITFECRPTHTQAKTHIEDKCCLCVCSDDEAGP